MESALQALSKGVQDLLYLTRALPTVYGVELATLRAEVGVSIPNPIAALCDNQRCVYICQPGQNSSVSKNRHVCVRAAFAREQVEEKNTPPSYIKSDANKAGWYTKPLPAGLFNKFTN